MLAAILSLGVTGCASLPADGTVIEFEVPVEVERPAIVPEVRLVEDKIDVYLNQCELETNMPCINVTLPVEYFKTMIKLYQANEVAKESI